LPQRGTDEERRRHLNRGSRREKRECWLRKRRREEEKTARRSRYREREREGEDDGGSWASVTQNAHRADYIFLAFLVWIARVSP
jgi:hypothetical protein